MIDFANHMLGKGYQKTSVESYIKAVKLFLGWLKSDNVGNLSYNQLLDYLSYLRRKGNTTVTVNGYLVAIQHYLGYQHMDTSKIESLRVRNKHRKILTAQVLPYRQLLALYQRFPAGTRHQKRYKVILGLMIFQGLNSRDIGLLKVDDIDARKGIVKVPSNHKSNNRVLHLDDSQIWPLLEYLYKIRHQFGCVATNRGKLFLSKSPTLKMVLHQMLVNLKKMNKAVVSGRQIRASVINHWLHQYNLRKVQYMAGHRYISSTEKYIDLRLKELETDLEIFHPMGII